MNWDAFLMGISDFGLERLKEERQLKMEKDLMEMRQKYEQDSAKFQQKLKDKADSKRSAGTRETADGRIQHQNVFGEDIGDPFEQSSYVKESRDRERETHEHNISRDNANLDMRRAELQARREANRIAGSGVSGGAGAGVSTGQAANDLMSDFEDLVKSYESAGSMTRPEMQELAHAALRSATAGGADVADTFRRTLQTFANRREAKVPGYQKRP